MTTWSLRRSIVCRDAVAIMSDYIDGLSSEASLLGHTLEVASFEDWDDRGRRLTLRLTWGGHVKSFRVTV